MRRRSGGRESRKAMRAGPRPNPAPPGQMGWHYRPLSAQDITRIIDAAMALLATLGMGEVPDRLARDLCGVGATKGAEGRLRFPRPVVEAAIASAPKKITLHGRDPARTITVGGNRVHFGTGGAAVQTLDLDTGQYRAATLADLRAFTRLQDALMNISWFTRCCIATDVADPFELDVNTAHALLRHTTRPVATAFTLAEHIDPIVQMLDIAAGGPGRFAERPFLAAHISPVISPMRYGADAVDVTYGCLAHNIPVSCITAAQAGATAPAPPAAFLVQSLAETLASLVMVQAIRPGHPMIFSNWPFVIDLRTGAFSGGGGETALMNAASAQITGALGLPSGVAASMTDAKLPDAQYGIEKAMTALAAGLAGGNMIYESSGMMAALLGVSFEAFVIDDEMHSAIYRVLRGIEVSDQTLDIAAISEAILTDGHFLGAGQTQDAMERDYYYPGLSDRDAPRAWQEAGGRSHWDRAREKARAILATHRPQYLSDAQEAAIRATLPIRPAD